MRSMCEVLWEVADGKIQTREDAEYLLAHEVSEYAKYLHMTPAGAHALLIRALTRLAARATPTQHDKLVELFDLPKEGAEPFAIPQSEGTD